MRFDPGKAWPHPVLRPHSLGDDYPHAEFEVDIELKRVEKSTIVQVDVTFDLSDPTLLLLVDQAKAQYSLMVKAPKTHYRRLFQSAEPYFSQSFPAGVLSGRVELSPFLVCTGPLPDFLASGWHSDFIGRTFDIPAGAVLAEDFPKEYWIDTADEAPLGSIFGHKPRPGMPNGQWEVEMAEDRIWIVMSEGDARRFQVAREGANHKPEGQYLMNGLYLPALVSVLNDVDQNPSDYKDSRWFASLDQRLGEVNCRPLGRDGSNRLIDAQKLLDSPFLRMPLIAQATSES